MKNYNLLRFFSKNTSVEQVTPKTLRLAILLSASLSFSQAAIQCTDYNDFKQFNGHYYTATVQKMTFEDAKKLAEDSGGYLAIPDSKAENDFLSSLFRGGQYAWIGVYDPSYTSNYCVEGSSGCIYDDSRFKTVKGNPLTYKNWAQTQPDNLLKKYDIVDGKERVSPLGEHWVAMASPSGQWSDQGNHFGDTNNPVRNYALLEFDKIPDCAGGGSDGGDNGHTATDAMQCNTNFSDDPNFKPANGQGQSIACLQNSQQKYFCPAQLTQCVNSDDAVDGSSKKIEGGVLKTGKTKVRLTFSKSIGYNAWQVVTNDIYITDIDAIDSFKLVYAGADDWVVPFAPNSTVAVVGNKPNNTKDALDYIPYRPNNDNYGELSKFSGKNLNIELKQYLHTGINKSVAFFATVGSGGWQLTYEATGKDISCSNFGRNLNCTEESETIPFSAYKYTCPAGYQPKEQGGVCSPQSVDDLIDTNGDGIGDSCNSSIAPAKNCLGVTRTCPFNSSRECVLIDNKYQCSPFPCFKGVSDVENTDTPVGVNDANNNGWNDDGTCSGQIIIFNGQDNRCKNWDMFGGLLGGGCCDKDNVFLGLVACKEDEKKLAKLNDAGKCHEVGTYCSKKVSLGFTKICVEKKKSFCCFNSKLGRIFNEQGRPQLGKGWGSAEGPQCRGFTPEEFQKLDFSEIDLSEFIADIVGSFDTGKIQADSVKIQEKIQNNIENATKKPTN
ncbi:TPA: conjugal transfer protein TraN [Campylobacter jejuni]|nr:conjugal transfer protein TraN [Campylobacter jejuni]HEF6395378.1 conjugal transfer protein TraN [Campylobacter jejuni]HEF6446146.1 conjugal transfer protein TraN [Campylobacter jejuni]HEF7432537.1 conjugal transfer protein TraN [Campylobacter jejuni]